MKTICKTCHSRSRCRSRCRSRSRRRDRCPYGAMHRCTSCQLATLCILCNVLLASRPVWSSFTSQLALTSTALPTAVSQAQAAPKPKPEPAKLAKARPESESEPEPEPSIRLTNYPAKQPGSQPTIQLDPTRQLRGEAVATLSESMG